DPPVGAAEITAIESSPDGCHRFGLVDEQGDGAFYLCVPPAAQPFQVGEAIEVLALSNLSGPFAESGEGAGVGEGLVLRSASHEVIVARGNSIARRSFDGDAEPSAD